MGRDLERIAETLEVLRKVEERKREARKYDFMAEAIARKLGREGREYESMIHVYEDERLRIKETVCLDRDSDYIGSIIDIRTPSNRSVFRTSTQPEEITIYRPGEWEEHFKELYEPLKPQEVSEEEEEVQIKSMTEWELKGLKDKFGLE